MKVIDMLRSTEWEDIEKEIGCGISEPTDAEKTKWKRFWKKICSLEPKPCEYVYYIKPTCHDYVFDCDEEMPRSFVITELGEMSYYSAGYILRNKAISMEISEDTITRFSYGKICVEFLGTILALGYREETAIKNWSRFYGGKPMVTD